jgi:hypothetical protein
MLLFNYIMPFLKETESKSNYLNFIYKLFPLFFLLFLHFFIQMSLQHFKYNDNYLILFSLSINYFVVFSFKIKFD